MKHDYTEPEAARLLGISKETLRQWRLGYTVTTKNGTRYSYPAKFPAEQGIWWKVGSAPNAPVCWKKDWVDHLAEMRSAMKKALDNS